MCGLCGGLEEAEVGTPMLPVATFCKEVADRAGLSIELGFAQVGMDLDSEDLAYIGAIVAQTISAMGEVMADHRLSFGPNWLLSLGVAQSHATGTTPVQMLALPKAEREKRRRVAAEWFAAAMEGDADARRST